MGFYLYILIAHPSQRFVKKTPNEAFTRDPVEENKTPSKKYTLWKINNVLAVGRVTRIEKITAPQFSHIKNSFGPQERAGICLVDTVFPKITEMLRKPKKFNFAPQFAVDEKKHSSSFSWQQENLTFEHLGKDTEFTEPIEAPFGGGTIPSYEHMLEHNGIVRSKDSRFEKYIKKSYGLVYSRPFMWESCTEIALWLNQMETEHPKTWEALSKDPGAVEYMHAWRSYLTHMGKTGARGIFIFESLDIFSVV